jgi:hypothetical protein
MKRSVIKDKLYKAIGKGERTSKKVSYITKADGTRFRRRNANKSGDAQGGLDYVENRPNRTDFYPKDKRKKIMKTGGKTPEEIAYEQEQEDAMFNSQYAKGSTVKSGGVESELYVAEYQKGQWTVKDKKNPNANYTLSSKKENAENVRQALIDSPSKLKYYRSNEYAKGGKTPEEAYEQEQYDAMYDSTYGKGGKTGCWCYEIGGL